MLTTSEMLECFVLFCSCLSLCKLIQYALESQDPRLQGIEVQGDQIFGAGDSIKTRSKSRQCKHAALVEFFIFPVSCSCRITFAYTCITIVVLSFSV